MWQILLLMVFVKERFSGKGQIENIHESLWVKIFTYFKMRNILIVNLLQLAESSLELLHCLSICKDSIFFSCGLWRRLMKLSKFSIFFTINCDSEEDCRQFSENRRKIFETRWTQTLSIVHVSWTCCKSSTLALETNKSKWCACKLQGVLRGLVESKCRHWKQSKNMCHV